MERVAGLAPPRQPDLVKLCGWTTDAAPATADETPLAKDSLFSSNTPLEEADIDWQKEAVAAREAILAKAVLPAAAFVGGEGVCVRVRPLLASERDRLGQRIIGNTESLHVETRLGGDTAGKPGPAGQGNHSGKPARFSAHSGEHLRRTAPSSSMHAWCGAHFVC